MTNFQRILRRLCPSLYKLPVISTGLTKERVITMATIPDDLLAKFQASEDAAEKATAARDGASQVEATENVNIVASQGAITQSQANIIQAHKTASDAATEAQDIENDFLKALKIHFGLPTDVPAPVIPPV